MNTEDATPLIIDIAKSFVSLMRSIEPRWSKAYLRCCVELDVSEAKASYIRENGSVQIVDVLQHKAWFRDASGKVKPLFEALEKSGGVFLLEVTGDLNYKYQFEYADPQRWRISKLGGGAGIPEGVS